MSTIQQGYIDRMNYYNDSRTQRRVPVPVELPTCWAICGQCEGDGRMVNPSIDAGGLSDDMAHDPEFMDGYMSGVYDVPCSECSGSGKVREIDRSREDFAVQIAEYDDECQAMADSEAEHRAEMIMGC